MNIFQAAKNGNIERIKELLSEGIDVNTKDTHGWTALILSCVFSNKKSSIETVKLLLEYGADINIQDNKGWTSLMYASRHSNEVSNIETVKLLLEYDANVNIQNKKGLTALMYSSGESNHNSSLYNVKLLLQYGAKINIQDNSGKTALYYSSLLSNKESNIETVKLLLENGANPFIKNNDNKYPIDLYTTRKWKPLFYEYMWKTINQNICKSAIQYSRSGDFPLPKDVWELILLRNKLNQLCKNLSSDENKEILYYFGLTLELPINKEMTKSELYIRISEQLVFGRYYNEKAKNFTQNRINKTKNKNT